MNGLLFFEVGLFNKNEWIVVSSQHVRADAWKNIITPNNERIMECYVTAISAHKIRVKITIDAKRTHEMTCIYDFIS